ncbi:MAG: hypothetical protein OEW05_09520 [Candidatus Aminicenantes bacterium]|nr:hypothetical protein [Candidatus Aminicenantes bacterium]
MHDKRAAASGSDRTAIAVSLLLLAAVFLYAFVARPWFMNWGATEEEQAAAMPGDHLVPRPISRATRAVTIQAPPDKVWPWLVQLGEDRAAFYSYTWLENLLGVEYRNADRIHPEWQDLGQGGFVRFAPRGHLFGLSKEGPGSSGWSVPLFEPGRAMNLQPGWGTFLLEPQVDGRTRLIIRTLGAPVSPVVRPLFFFGVDAIHFMMEKRMMVEVKRLAEGRPGAPVWLTWMAHLGFAAIAVLCALWILALKRQRGWLALPIIYGLIVLVSSRDAQGALVAVTALALALTAFLVFRRRWWVLIGTLWIYSYSVLILATDAYVVFGLSFLVMALAILILSRPAKKAAAPAS